MKVCITARCPILESAFERHFAQAPYFILYNTRTGKSEAIRNGFVLSVMSGLVGIRYGY